MNLPSLFDSTPLSLGGAAVLGLGLFCIAEVAAQPEREIVQAEVPVVQVVEATPAAEPTPSRGAAPATWQAAYEHVSDVAAASYGSRAEARAALQGAQRALELAQNNTATRPVSIVDSAIAQDEQGYWVDLTLKLDPVFAAELEG